MVSEIEASDHMTNADWQAQSSNGAQCAFLVRYLIDGAGKAAGTKRPGSFTTSRRSRQVDAAIQAEKDEKEKAAPAAAARARAADRGGRGAADEEAEERHVVLDDGRKRVAQETFDKVFAGWTDKDWKSRRERVQGLRLEVSASMRAAPGSAFSAAVSLAVTLVLGTLLSGRDARADILQMKDGRFVDGSKAGRRDEAEVKMERSDAGVVLHYPHGDVLVPKEMVKDVLIEKGGSFEGFSEEEKAQLDRGLVPLDGKWVPKAERERLVAKRTEDQKKRIDEARAHREWRNRYKTESKHFRFEYTLPPEIFEPLRDLLEVYYETFTKKWKIKPDIHRGRRRPPLSRRGVLDQVSNAREGVIGHSPIRRADRADSTTPSCHHRRRYLRFPFADLFSFRDHRPHAGGRKERGNSRAPRAHALGKRALRIEFHLDFTVQYLLLKKFVLADVAGDHLLDLMRLQQQPEPGVHRARVVRDARQIFRALAAHGGNEVFGNAAGSETAE